MNRANHLNRLMSQLFPIMALTGLLLAGWGLLITPDEIKNDSQQGALWGARITSTTLDAIQPASWRD